MTDDHAVARPPASSGSPPMLSAHETWLTTVAFVAVSAAGLAALSMMKIVNSGDKALQAVALGLSVVALIGVAALAAGSRRFADAADAANAAETGNATAASGGAPTPSV